MTVLLVLALLIGWVALAAIVVSLCVLSARADAVEAGHPVPRTGVGEDAVAVGAA